MANRKFFYQDKAESDERVSGAQETGNNKDRRPSRGGARRNEERGNDKTRDALAPSESQKPERREGARSITGIDPQNGTTAQNGAPSKSRSAAAKPQNGAQSNRRPAPRDNEPRGERRNADRRRNYPPGRQPQRRAQGASERQIAAASDAAKLEVAVSALKLSDKTSELLEKNRFKTLADLVRRTEKDMFRIQGFGKKNLFEIKDALAREGMAFKPEVRTQESGRGAERKNQSKQNPRQAAKPAPVREKLTEPLPVAEWRKIQKGGKWGFYDGFKTVIPAEYDEVFCFKDGLASVEKEELCGYIDSENNVVIPLEYETAMSFSEGLASVVKGGKCGYIDKNNEVIIPFEYDAATAFEGGEAKIKKDGRWGTITPDGSVKWI